MKFRFSSSEGLVFFGVIIEKLNVVLYDSCGLSGVVLVGILLIVFVYIFFYWWFIDGVF